MENLGGLKRGTYGLRGKFEKLPQNFYRKTLRSDDKDGKVRLIGV